MRLNYLIKSRYEIDPALDLEVAEIPALMVQPLVENAILHGISPLKKSGELTIRFIREGSTLFVEVEDNGVGRKKAQKFKARIKKKINKVSGNYCEMANGDSLPISRRRLEGLLDYFRQLDNM